MPAVTSDAVLGGKPYRSAHPCLAILRQLGPFLSWEQVFRHSPDLQRAEEPTHYRLASRRDIQPKVSAVVDLCFKVPHADRLRSLIYTATFNGKSL